MAAVHPRSPDGSNPSSTAPSPPQLANFRAFPCRGPGGCPTSLLHRRRGGHQFGPSLWTRRGRNSLFVQLVISPRHRHRDGDVLLMFGGPGLCSHPPSVLVCCVLRVIYLSISLPRALPLLLLYSRSIFAPSFARFASPCPVLLPLIAPASGARPQSPADTSSKPSWRLSATMLRMPQDVRTRRP